MAHFVLSGQDVASISIPMPLLPCGTAAYTWARLELVYTLSGFPPGMNEGTGHSDSTAWHAFIC